MIPINSKPVIGHILDDLMERGVYRAIIVLHQHDRYTEKYVKIRYEHKMEIIICYKQDDASGLVGTIFEGMQYYKSWENSSVLVYLGDTIYKGSLSLVQDFLTVSDEFEESSLWCFVENDNFVNRPKDYVGSGKILTGIFFFSDANILLKCLCVVQS